MSAKGALKAMRKARFQGKESYTVLGVSIVFSIILTEPQYTMVVSMFFSNIPL